MNDTDDAGTACASAASMTAPGMITPEERKRMHAAWRGGADADCAGRAPADSREREDPPARALRRGWRASGSPLRSGAGKGGERGGA